MQSVQRGYGECAFIISSGTFRLVSIMRKNASSWIPEDGLEINMPAAVYFTIQDVIEIIEDMLMDTVNDEHGYALTCSEVLDVLDFNNHIRHVVSKLQDKYIKGIENE